MNTKCRLHFKVICFAKGLRKNMTDLKMLCLINLERKMSKRTVKVFTVLVLCNK